MTESDRVLRLGWLQDPQSASDGLHFLQEWVRANEEFCSEADTKAAVEAVLRGLGWDTLTGDVAREGDCNLGDFHLYCRGGEQTNRKICALLEAEALHKKAGALQGEPLRQLDDYLRKLVEPEQETEAGRWIAHHRLKAGGAVFAHAVLTNGRRWWIYNRGNSNDGATLVYPPPIEFDLLDPSNLDAVISDLGKERLCAKVEAFLQHNGPRLNQ